MPPLLDGAYRIRTEGHRVAVALGRACPPLILYTTVQAVKNADFDRFLGGILSKLRTLRQMTRRDKDARKRLIQGIARWQMKGQIIRFVTLTGTENSPIKWRKLKSKLSLLMGKLEYLGVQTAEGLGVVHFVYIGKSIYVEDLRKIWLAISGFWNVHISTLRNVKTIVNEMTRQHQVVRYFSSRHWLSSRDLQTDFDKNLLDKYYNEVGMRFSA